MPPTPGACEVAVFQSALFAFIYPSRVKRGLNSSLQES